jgi:hypothetical protein
MHSGIGRPRSIKGDVAVALIMCVVPFKIEILRGTDGGTLTTPARQFEGLRQL